MSDQIRWDIDPPRDKTLARLLRAGNAAVPLSAVDWGRLRSEVMRRAVGGAGGDWWDFVAEWGRVAMAASVAAMFASGVLLWQATSASPEPVAPVPESVAIARVATDYPVETAFASLVRTEHHDEFTAWGVR